MSAKLRIQDGNPVWLSPSIVPSKDIVVSPNSSPSLATINVNSNDVFVYVKVENTGTLDLGGCTCTSTGAWAIPSLFQGFLANPTATASQTRDGATFSASANGDSLSGAGINFWFGLSASGRRAWAWSPDGRSFAYAASPNGPDWFLTIVSLQNITRSDGSTVLKGHVAATASGLFAGSNPIQYWTNANFGWAGSKAVVASGAYAGGPGWTVSLACPEAPSPNVWENLFPVFPGEVEWALLVSPCGSVVAFAPKRLNSSAPPQTFFMVSTATATETQFRKNNAPTSISSTGANVSMTTTAHTANGVTVNTGNGTTVTVDDPDCTLVGGGIIIRVDRVKASTLPSANLGVLPVGTAVLGILQVGKNSWVKVPNQSGWANQSEKHWCLLAQAYTVDGATIPRPWNGQAANPPPFPIINETCAQRNIEISP
ncbi:hypothetical protein HZA56_20535 [Candidatus Poribacteria bacterium]|nr:hypothetical protein [Candidatus Poribacteria bacterium]